MSFHEKRSPESVPSTAESASAEPPRPDADQAVPAGGDSAGGLLHPLGFDEAWAREFREHVQETVRVPGASPEPARVTRTDRGACDVLAEHGALRVTWGADVIAAVARDPLAVPSAGDWVAVQRWPDGRMTLEAVLPRRTRLTRAQADGSSAGQVLAANADVVAVVEGLVPNPDLGRIERLLALAWDSGAAPRLVLTKADLVPGVPGVDELAARISRDCGSGAPVDVVAAVHAQGISALLDLLAAGATVALLGASGVGKSTLHNALVGGELMATRSLGAAHKGRHTTVTRELHLAAAGGSVIDTPGVRSIGLLGEAGLDDVFAEVEELASNCRFTDCGHRGEPGCAVQDALDSGELSERRLASWRKLRREAAYQARRVDVQLRHEQRQLWKQRAKEGRRRARP